MVAHRRALGTGVAITRRGFLQALSAVAAAVAAWPLQPKTVAPARDFIELPAGSVWGLRHCASEGSDATFGFRKLPAGMACGSRVKVRAFGGIQFLGVVQRITWDRSGRGPAVHVFAVDLAQWERLRRREA